MPSNPLTEALRDFRSYRPRNHTDWLSYVESSAKELGVLKYAMEDSVSQYHLIENLDKNREFRTIHWDLTKTYIITKSKHPLATGGAPIISWLPNQLIQVLKTILKTKSNFDNSKLSPTQRERKELIVLRAEHQLKELEEEIARLKKERGHD